jgi:trimeric autotransporter adhesin
VRLFFLNKARRVVGLTALSFFALPLGLSVIGCGHHAAPVVFCNAGDSGPVVGQVAKITLASSLATTGESLNYAQIGTALNASATDCHGNAVSVKSFTYSSTSSFSNNTNGGPIFADINPSNGTVCGGTWNLNTGGGVQNYTLCTAPTSAPISTTAVALSITSPTTASAATATLTLNQAIDTVSGTLNLSVGSAAPVAITVPANTTLTALASLINAQVAQALATSQQSTPPTPDPLQGISAAVTTGNTQFLTITGPVGAVLNTSGTTLNDSTASNIAYVTASAAGATSNAIAVYVHPVVTGVVLGPATPGAVNGSCPAGTTDPGTDCCPNDTVGTPVPTPAGVVDGSKCISQNQVGQLVARIYQNGGSAGSFANNITCQVGHVTFGAQTNGIVSIDQNGAATAGFPGSTTITATISNSSTATNAGYFSTCPVASIVLADPSNPSATSIPVNVNTLQPLNTTVLDTLGNPLTGITLEYNSTTPQTIPATSGAGGSVTPAFPGSANITAVCQPGTCNPSPFAQIGLYGNGKAITSNPITITSPGTSSTVLYMGSTSSQYLSFRDFTTNQPSALIKLPYVPNSMVMNQAGTEIYLGSPQGLMSVATASNAVSTANQNIPGVVLAVSPDGSTLVITDPTRQTISLVAASNSTVLTSYNGVGTSASWSPDAQAVYITTATIASGANLTAITASPTITPSATVTPSPVVLTHSSYTDWQTATAAEGYTDAAVTVPSIGAYFAGPSTTDGRSYCSASTISTPGDPDAGSPATMANEFIPLVDSPDAMTDQIAATTDGKHIIGARAMPGGTSTLTDLDLVLPLQPSTASGSTNYGCPIPPAPQPTIGYFSSSKTVQPLTGINASTITSVVPSSNSTAAFVTYILASGATAGGGLLPLYLPPATGSGTVQLLTLGNGATAASSPVSGVFSTDNSTFYAGTGSSDGTSVDDDVHLITLTYPASGAPTAAETGILSPNLPAASGTNYAPVNLIAQHPKKTTT